MNRLVIVLIAATLFTGTVLGQKSDDETAVTVTNLTMPENSNVGEVSGDIKNGQKISLRWAESSSVACFPGTRFEMFNGNNVFYRVAMPAASTMKVTVTPDNGAAINLYALRQGANSTDAPPNIARAISCEASYPIYANMGGGRTVKNKDDGFRTVEYISVNSPYSILIGIGGAKGLTEGGFKLKIEISPR